jgi:hypothetical protein
MPVNGEPLQSECRHESGLVPSGFQVILALAAVFVMPSIKRMPVAGVP